MWRANFTDIRVNAISEAVIGTGLIFLNGHHKPVSTAEKILTVMMLFLEVNQFVICQV
jgi:hypothetical protein